MSTPVSTKQEWSRRQATTNQTDVGRRFLERRLAQLLEGETRLRAVCSTGTIFETDYVSPRRGDRVFTAIWLNADGKGFMDEANGDHIMSIQW